MKGGSEAGKNVGNPSKTGQGDRNSRAWVVTSPEEKALNEERRR